MNNSLPPIDGIEEKPSQQESVEEQVSTKATGRLKGAILLLLSVPYILFLLWAGFLFMVLPSPVGAYESLIFPGTLSALAFGGLLLFVGLIGLQRIMKRKVTNVVRVLSAARLVGFVLPGLLVAGFLPAYIAGEPPLSVQITDPTTPEELIAPLGITFNMDLAVELLERRGLKPVKYMWDFDADGEPNDETVIPETIALYDKPGAYTLQVIVELNNGTKRYVSRSIVIPQAVFSYSPERPGVDEPIRFSVAHLVDNPEDIVSVEWDFNNDTIIDVTTDLPETAHTYLRTGTFPVTAVVELSNNSQKSYSRDVTIFEPEPPPFPVSIISEPETLISPAPFGTIFRVESEEPIDHVIWDFGDGSKSRGERVGHNFEDRGVYQVKARVHAQSGEVAELIKVVRVVESLQLSSLTFEGTPTVDRNKKMSGEVPVTVNLKARTNLPLVDIAWEAPGATSVGSTEGDLQAIYRRPGEYEITMIAQDPQGKVTRSILKLTVDPPSSNVAIRMTPEGGVAPLLVRFDASETVIPDEEITGFEWSFGDTENSAAQQRGAQVEYLFKRPGTFTVKLVAYTTSGKSYSADKTIVVRAPVLDACLLPSRTSGRAPLGVSFSMSCSTGDPTTVTWDFGDGASSDNKNPIHVFETPGIYQVKLTLEDDLGTKSTTTTTITAE